MFERQVVCRAFSRACANTGNRIAARMAMIAMTTSSSIRVKPGLRTIACLLVFQRRLSGASVFITDLSLPVRKSLHHYQGIKGLQAVPQEGDALVRPRS